MSFKIERNDITKVHTDAIVNTANPLPRVGRGTDTAVYIQLSEFAAVGLQTAGHYLGVYVYCSAPHFPYSSLSPLSGMVTDRIRREGTTDGSLCHCHCLLRTLLLPDAVSPHPSFHGEYCDGSLGHSGRLWYHQPMVENQYAYGSHRWSDRRTFGFLFGFLL